ncbi:MAG: dTMP kinase [Rhodospirillaceae bacterium]
MTSAAPHRFITFEGIDGSGKSTQARWLAERLSTHGQDVYLTREPGAAPGTVEEASILRDLILKPTSEASGERLFDDPVTETLLHVAARQEHLRKAIRPRLADGAWVVCDRFSDSTAAYQGGGGGVDPALLAALQHAVVGDMGPTLTILLDIDPGIAQQRLAVRDPSGVQDRYEARGQAFFARIRATYLEIAAQEPERVVLLPADQPPEQLADQIAALLWQRFPDAGLPAAFCPPSVPPETGEGLG